tara:strand:+ start:523 stop:687 length:165 start_codon:yes stop_codon:yes gene_type:complete
MMIGSLIISWGSDDDVALVVDRITDQWSDRYLIFSNGEIFEVPAQQMRYLYDNR